MILHLRLKIFLLLNSAAALKNDEIRNLIFHFNHYLNKNCLIDALSRYTNSDLDNF